MLNSGPLVPFGWAIMIMTAVLIVVPFARRRADAVTAWNLLLLSGGIFFGMGSLEVFYGQWHWPELQWFQPTSTEIEKFMFGTTIFYVTLLISYYWLNLPRQIAAKVFNKWPPMTPSLVYWVLGVCGVLAVMALFTRSIVFVGPLLFNISHKAILFATVFSFCNWYRRKTQLPLLAIFIGTFLFSCLYAMTVFSGRRLLLSVAVSPLICMYWLQWRYSSPKTNMIRLGTATMIAILITGFHQTFRHYDISSSGQVDRTFSGSIQAMKRSSADLAIHQITGNLLHYFAQYSVHNSLLTIHLVDQKKVEVAPLNSLVFLAAYPIPRKIWTTKPVTLGEEIVHGVLNLPYQTNWGLGIVGIGYREGGYFVIALYAFLAVIGIRVIDDSLRRQPNNMFLLSVLCAGAPHIVSWVRGEPVNMTIEVGEAVVFAWALGLAARFLFGTAQSTTQTGIQMPTYNQQYTYLGHTHT